jgi:hypothetical protein
MNDYNMNEDKLIQFMTHVSALVQKQTMMLEMLVERMKELEAQCAHACEYLGGAIERIETRLPASSKKRMVVFGLRHVLNPQLWFEICSIDERLWPNLKEHYPEFEVLCTVDEAAAKNYVDAFKQSVDAQFYPRTQ